MYIVSGMNWDTKCLSLQKTPMLMNDDTTDQLLKPIHIHHLLSSSRRYLDSAMEEDSSRRPNNQFFYADLPQTIWFAIGSFLQQGTEVIPSSGAGHSPELLIILIHPDALTHDHGLSL